MLVDKYLAQILDCPLVEGYCSHDLESNLKMSKSLVVWNDNINTIDLVPETRNFDSGDIL